MTSLVCVMAASLPNKAEMKQSNTELFLHNQIEFENWRNK